MKLNRHVKTLAQNIYGINDIKMIRAAGLDLIGADPEKILRETIDKTHSMYQPKN